MKKIAKPGKYLTFKLGEEYYGIEVSFVREINSMLKITPVPQVPAYVKGVIDLRGSVISVIDLRLKLGMEPVEYTKETCIIILDLNSERQFGIIIDKVSEVKELCESEIETVNNIGNGEINSEHLVGIGKVSDNVIMLLDLTCFLEIREIKPVSDENDNDQIAS